MDRNEQALSDYTKALTIRPKYRDALAARERAEKELGKAKRDDNARTQRATVKSVPVMDHGQP